MTSSIPPAHSFPRLQKAWIQWCSLLWQGNPTESFPDNDQGWINWLRNTGLDQWQQLWLTAPDQVTVSLLKAAKEVPPIQSDQTPSATTATTELVTLRHIPPISECLPSGETILLIPPCSHRADIFDLEPTTSLVQKLIALGHHVVILEWNTPSLPSTSAPTWNDYRLILQQTLEALYSQDQTSLHVIGLCLGGVMALDVLTLATLPTSPLPPVRSLTLLATLLDYRSVGPLSCLQWPPFGDNLRQHLRWMPWIPAPLIYSACCVLMPSMPPTPSLLSQWNQQGLNVSGPLALELLEAFYSRNHLIEPNKPAGSSPLSRLNIPLYAVGGLNDRLVPIHGLFNGLHHCPPSTPIRLSLFEAGHLRCFLPGRVMNGHQGSWQGESVERWLNQAEGVQTTGWVEDWNKWIKTLKLK